MKTKLLFLALSIGVTCFAQNAQVDTLKGLYVYGKFDDVINYKDTHKEDFAGKSLYYIGMAYYMKEDDSNAARYLDMAIKKGPVDADMYYYRGMVNYYDKKFNNALALFDKALSMKPGEPDYYGSKADVYLELLKYDTAMVYLKKATSLPDCKARYYVLVAEVLNDENKSKDALAAYKEAIKKIDPGVSPMEYRNCIYNIALIEELTGDSASSLATYEKYVKLYPGDYHGIAKLIQGYYATRQYDKAKPYKKMLYDAHKKDSLPDEMKDMFCFDQFMWKGKRVMAFEHYDEPDTVYSYIKHTFYVLNDSDKILFRVQSESDAMLHKDQPDKKYVLCLVDGSGYHTFWNFLFNDDVPYPDLKNAVLNILNGNSKPAAETIIHK